MLLWLLWDGRLWEGKRDRDDQPQQEGALPDGDDAWHHLGRGWEVLREGDLENEGDDNHQSRMAKKEEVKNEEEEKRWLQDLVESHPVLRQLLDHLKKGVVETSAVDLKMIPGYES